MSLSRKQKLELEHQLMKLQTAKKGMEYRIAECEETIDKLNDNMQIQDEAIADIESQLGITKGE